MKNYRADIDGLRAIAVLLVLFFHVDWLIFKAGFIGVDVFFTISGFLITSIILKEIKSETFTFIGFYRKRAFRLLPAYLFMLIVVVAAFYFILGPLAYKDLLLSGLASTVFASNFYFFLEHGGYFSTLAVELPLLHTWSLSVEEQFYMLMPVLLVIWAKFLKSKWATWIFGTLLLASIFVSYYLTLLNQSAAYFLLFARFHELFIGSILAVFISKNSWHQPKLWIANALFTIALILILAVAIALESKRSFPGVIALIPCLASAAILYAGTNSRCISHKLLGCKLLVLIGLISYSLYLWHWPIIAALKYVGADMTPIIQFGIIFTSFILATISYHFVEKKVRYGSVAKSNKAMVMLYVLPVAVFTLLFFTEKNFRNDANLEFVAAEKAHRSKPNEWRGACHSEKLQQAEKCLLGDLSQGKMDAILWGDSHANHFAPFLDEILKINEVKAMDITMGSCPPVHDSEGFTSQSCQVKNETALRFIESSNASTIYLAASWYGYSVSKVGMVFSEEKANRLLVSLERVIKKLSQKGKTVVVFDTLARLPTDTSACSLKAVKFNFINPSSCDFERSSDQIEMSERIKLLTERFDNVNVIDVNNIICNGKTCHSSLDGVPIFRDSNHLNIESARLLARKHLAL